MNRTDTIKNQAPGKPFAIYSLLLGLVGWFASFELLTEYIKTLVQPEYSPNCNISVLVTCGPNMGSWQGSVLGFSNTIIGVAAFVAPIIVGVSVLAGAKFSRWFWGLYLLGLAGGFFFIHWLAYQSIFSLNTLCPWCMVVWTVMIPLFWLSAGKLFGSGLVSGSGALKKLGEAVSSWAWVIIILNYLLIAAVSQLRLNWLFSEFGIAIF